MSESGSAGDRTPPSYRPVPRHRKPSDDQVAPALPAKHSVYVDKDVDCRLGIISKPAAPVTPQSPLPSPPDQTKKRLRPELPPRSDKHTGEELARGVADAPSEESRLHENATDFDLYVDARAENDRASPSVASILPSSGRNEAPAISTTESSSVSQTEPLQMRSKFPAPADMSAANRPPSQLAIAARASLFVTAVEKSVKSDRPAPVQPGRLVISDKLAGKLGSVLNRQQTMRSVQQMEEQRDVAIDIRGSEMPAGTRKPSTDNKSMLYTESSFC